MDVLKIATAGSVDDGKSTLIGRLLYDTKSLTDDKLNAIEISSKKKGYDYLDFSLATDGLIAEREQGITIDVAHIYFSTRNRSYIIADTPGHVEYTRNMVTGASTSQASIILIDARKGVIEQTYRHFFITNLLRIKHVIVAVNKMDLVDYSEKVFHEIKESFEALNAKSNYKGQQIEYVPISALNGDNVVQSSTKMDWYNGTTILNHLEKIESETTDEKSVARLPVQNIVRPKKEAFHDFRGYSGKVNGANLKVGDNVTVLPSKKTSSISSIHFFDKVYGEAVKGSSVTVTLKDDINIARGNVIVKSEELPKETKILEATVCWMDSKALQLGGKYTIQHHTNTILGKIDEVSHTIATDFSGIIPTNTLKLNEIGNVKLKLSKPIYYDAFHENKTNGSFILIDPITNATAGVGFIN